MDEHANDMNMSPSPHAEAMGPGPSTALAWAACLLAGLAAALAAFGLGEASYEVFQPASVRRQQGPGMIDRPTPETKLTALISNTMLSYGGWGATLGAALGLAGGLTAGRSGLPAAGAIAGAVAGGLAGAILPVVAIPIAHRARFVMGMDPMIVGSAALAAMWGLIAALGAGLGFAIGGRRPASQAVVAALLGAVCGTVVYIAASTFLHPLAETDQPMPLVWQARLLARLLPSLGAAALLARVRPRVAREVVAA